MLRVQCPRVGIPINGSKTVLDDHKTFFGVSLLAHWVQMNWPKIYLENSPINRPHAPIHSSVLIFESLEIFDRLNAINTERQKTKIQQNETTFAVRSTLKLIYVSFQKVVKWKQQTNTLTETFTDTEQQKRCEKWMDLGCWSTLDTWLKPAAMQQQQWEKRAKQQT